MDELFTFVGTKKFPMRVWTAIDWDSRTFVEFYVGDGRAESLETFLKNSKFNRRLILFGPMEIIVIENVSKKLLEEFNI